MSGFDKLKEEVTRTGLCTACGTCIGVCPNRSLVFNWQTEVPEAVRECPEGCHLCKQACKEACPIYTDVPGYLALIARGKFQEAYKLIRKDNPLPAICGRVCYHPCEEACNRGQVDDALAIAALKRFAADQVDIEKLEVPQVTKIGKSVAIIGSGPAGLGAANDLALLGYDVTIFESLPEPGGMLRVGIPDYRLPKDLLRQEIGYIQRLGVEIKTNTKLGEQISLEGLRKSYQAIFIATGAHQSLKLGIPGEENSGVIQGVDFLRDINMGQRIEVGKRVAVIGGGNVAIDASRVARRLGASSVTIVYRRSRQEMPATPDEVKAAEAEGIEIIFLATPIKIIADNGKVSKAQYIRMKLGEPDATGRPRPIPIEGSEFTIDVDTVIPALGQAPNLEFVNGSGLDVSPDSRINVDAPTLATNIEGVFAGGDVVTGPETVINAIAAGKKAARSIDRYLKGEPLVSEEVGGVPEKLSEEEIVDIRERLSLQSRVEMPQLQPKERAKDFQEVEQGYSLEQAQEEARRCLSVPGEDVCYQVCPGKDIPRPELDRMLFGRERNADEELLGISRAFVRAYATDPIVRARAASGGLVSALLIYALENDVIDAAIVTGMSKEQPWKAVPMIATNRREVIASGQTKVTLCPTNSVLNEALDRGYKRLGIVGLPCHVHGIRKIQLYSRVPKVLNSIKFVIGLLCGMTRHGRMPEHVIEELLDVPLDEVTEAVLHGHQYPGLYAVTVKDGRVFAISDFARRLHTDAFTPDRCLVCYDWAADHADISAGGFLGREAMRGLSGISAAIVRTDIGEKLLKDAEAAGYIRTEPMERYKFFGTGFEGKKHGAPYNIVERRRFGRPTPDYHVPIDYPKPVLGKRF